MITFVNKGNFNKTEKFLNSLMKRDYLNELDRLAMIGLEALKKNTPVNTGKTKDSWDYEIHHNKKNTTIYWTNNNIKKGILIAVILQYGHATENGKFVKGIDYINPAMKPVFEMIADKVWEVVVNS